MFKIDRKLKLVIFFLSFFSSWSFSIDLDNSTNHLRTIVFGAGCFWSVEKKFQETFGVVDVKSGYADGKNIKPSYKEIIKSKNRFNPNNYAEVVKVTYNSNKTSLEKGIAITINDYLENNILNKSKKYANKVTIK